MDFSNLKKIFYIVAIISMILSIKSRVFASTPIQYFKQDVFFNSSDAITLNNQFSLIPMDYTLNDDYNLYTIIVKGTYQGSDVFEGYSITIHKGDKLNIKYSTTTNGVNNAYPRIYFSATNGINVVSFNINQDSSLQATYENRLQQFSNSDFWWDNPVQYSYSWASFEQFNNNFPNNILYSSNSSIQFLNNNNEIIDTVSPFTSPSFDNVTEIENGNPDGVFISAGDITNTDNLYFHLLRIDTGLSNSDQSIYYYSDKTFLLNKDSDYYRTWDDPSIEGFYYYIPRYKLGLSQNTSYLYVLNNSNKQIQNSQGIYEKDVENGIYDVLQSDTAGVISATEEESDRMKSIEESLQNTDNSINNINNSLNDTNVTTQTETDINSSLNFNNQNEGLNNLNNGFFSRLTSMLTNILGYDLAEDTSVSLPLPNSNKTITLHSKTIYDNVTGALRLIINAFWVYIFSFYMWKFINKIYIAVSTGHILDTFSSSGEAITNDML